MRRIIIFRAAGVLVILAICVLVFFLTRDGEMDKTVILTPDQTEDPGLSGITSTEEMTDLPIYVYLTGAVHSPGIYELPKGARLFEAVRLAGGLTNEADLSMINEAAFLEDGQHIHVPAVGETLRESFDDPKSMTVNINTDGPDRLQLLPGIGEAKAAAIVRYRTQYGAFSSIEDIMNVSGIGKALFEQIKDRIRVQ
ncbi:MAG: ComEA family DNA-binding protein [Lachnospiraceae bacterium]|nr:ComEA family DNA-binding protein [Lachnospiraceae bacterium]